MRWLFIFIVFINLFFAVWVSRQPSLEEIRNNRIQVNINNPDIASITLLSEHPEQAHKITPPINNQQVELKPTLTKGPFTCLYIGGATNQHSLDAINSFLKKENEAINLSSIKLNKAQRIQLYIKDTALGNKEDLLNKLNELSIDYTLIDKGRLKDSINLGVFTEEKDYKALIETLKQVGITTETQPISNTNASYWLKVLPEQRPLLTKKLLINLFNNIPSTTLAFMSCNITTTIQGQE